MRYLFLILILCSCSSLSKTDCQDTNWYIKGLADAQDGIREPKTKEYTQQCYSKDVRIKTFDYLKGYEDGIQTYCTVDNAIVLGANGEKPHNVCEEINSKFKPAYQRGLRSFYKEKAKEYLIELHGNECASNSDCKSGYTCQVVSQTTQFSDVISIKACSNDKRKKNEFI